MEMLSSPLGKAILVQLKAIVGVRLRALIRVSFTVYFLNNTLRTSSRRIFGDGVNANF